MVDDAEAPSQPSQTPRLGPGPAVMNRLVTAGALLVFVCTLFVRVRGISTHFWLLRDQIRDWSIALEPFTDLPLVGPATHVGGYTIGPGFYWILWIIRVTVGPWFQNLPHAGGIGQAILQSGADALLLVAVWRYTRSASIALATVVLIATASYDLCLAPLIWNPSMGSMLAKVATALVLLGWHRGSPFQATVTASVAWIAVHAYTGTIYVTTGVFAAFMLEPLVQRNWSLVRRNAATIVVTVAVLQLPYLAHQVFNQFGDDAMGAVWGSLGQVLSGAARPEMTKSLTGYVNAFQFIEGAPWHIPLAGWLLLAAGTVLAVAYRHDVTLVAIVLVPQVAAIAGYALFLDDLDHYYYLSLMPAAVLTIVLAVTAGPWPPLNRAITIALVAGSLALVPGRVQFAATMHRMPAYELLVEGARKIRKVDRPMRAIQTNITLPPTSSPEILYRALGGRLDPSSPWIGVIMADGSVVYQYARGS